MHHEEDQSAVVGDVHAPLFIDPDLVGMILQKLADEARIKVPDGASIRVLILSSGSTKTLKGPYEGTVAAYKDDRSWWERITGRDKDSDAPIGATRGMRPPQ